MFSKYKIIPWILLGLLATAACSPYWKMRKIRTEHLGMTISVPEEEPLEDEPEAQIDSIKGTLTEAPIIMNAIRDSETGEMIATDVITASKVTARFRNVAERAGYVSIGFDVTVPGTLSDSQWQLKIRPRMTMQEDTIMLDQIFITGKDYRSAQLRGYERYKAFLSTIITDTTDFIRVHQLEIFLERHFPETYAMKNDTSYVSEPLAENLFGVTQKEALMHYTKHIKKQLNERRKGLVKKKYDKYVKDPIVTEGIRLDTVLISDGGNFVYRYTHTFQARPRLKKVNVTLEGSLYEKGVQIHKFPFPDELTFYISSLSGLVDDTPKYRMIILERNVKDNTKALIDFVQGSSEIDTSLHDNASELNRVLRCIEDVRSRTDLVLDSLVIIASCSPEGAFSLNKKLSKERSESVRRYIEGYVPIQWKDSLKIAELPENWEQMNRLIANDTVLDISVRKQIQKMISEMTDPDETERELSKLPQYKYLREKIYPQLRSVGFDFHLHRLGMKKDTVHTTELDSVYMAGIEAMKDLDYKRAVTYLLPYGDYNSALACMSADYNQTSWEILSELGDDDSKVCYLKAMVLCRLDQKEEAMKYFRLSIGYDPYMEYRANLDPEMSELIKMYKKQPL